MSIYAVNLKSKLAVTKNKMNIMYKYTNILNIIRLCGTISAYQFIF